MSPELLSSVRKPKNCSLSETTIGYISEYGKMHNISFSHAIEGLALMSLRDQRMLGILSLLRQTIRSEILNQYNRFAKLLVHTAIEAGAAKEAAQHVYLLQLMGEMDEFVEAMEEEGGEISIDSFSDFLSIDPGTEDGEALINLYKQRRGRFRYRSVQALRRPIAEYTDLLDEMAQWADALEQRRMQQPPGTSSTTL